MIYPVNCSFDYRRVFRDNIKAEHSSHLVGWLGDGWWVFCFHNRRLSLPISLYNLCGAIRSSFLHNGHSL